MKNIPEHFCSSLELSRSTTNREACEWLLQQDNNEISIPGYSVPFGYQLLRSEMGEGNCYISLIHQDTDLAFQITVHKYYLEPDITPYFSLKVYRCLRSIHDLALEGLSCSLIRLFANKGNLIIGDQQLSPESKRFWKKRLYEATESDTLMVYCRDKRNQVIKIDDLELLLESLNQDSAYIITANEALFMPDSFEHSICIQTF